MEKILDIGCGGNRVPNSIGIDIDPNVNPDIVHNLNHYPFPLESNKFDKIYAKHIIEHLDDPISFVKEIFRLLKPGGIAFIATPHFSSYVAYSEPQHKLFYSYFLLTNVSRGLNIKVLNQEITFFKFHRAIGLSFLINKFPRTYEKFWTFMIPAENVTIEFQKIS